MTANISVFALLVVAWLLTMVFIVLLMFCAWFLEVFGGVYNYLTVPTCQCYKSTMIVRYYHLGFTCIKLESPDVSMTILECPKRHYFHNTGVGVTIHHHRFVFKGMKSKPFYDYWGWRLLPASTLKVGRRDIAKYPFLIVWRALKVYSPKGDHLDFELLF